jgi:transcription initiation factor TFIID subunit 7
MLEARRAQNVEDGGPQQVQEQVVLGHAGAWVRWVMQRSRRCFVVMVETAGALWCRSAQRWNVQKVKARKLWPFTNHGIAGAKAATTVRLHVRTPAFTDPRIYPRKCRARRRTHVQHDNTRRHIPNAAANMKLKLKNPNAAPSDAPTPAPSEPPQADASTPVSAKGPSLGLKLKLKPSAPAPSEVAGSQHSDGAKAKRKYTKKPKVDESGNPIPSGKPGPKKRARDEGDDFDSPAAKRKPKPTAKSLAMAEESDDDDLTAVEQPPQPIKQVNRTQSIKLSIKPKGGMGASASQKTGTAILKVKGAGKPPPRPYGVGYDSEAEEAEPDPAIESQFVLRMKPGADCDLLRKSIEEKTIGKSVSQGGPGVHFRFFDREGRRTMVTIQGRLYAATMVELPAVIESLKSWNKKDWVKTADVCQMLLVLDRVQNEDEAKKFPLPSTVSPDSHRYPHGLTPPMRWARKRRFRPRKSYIDVERAEAQMNRLLAEDENAHSTKYEMVDTDAETSEDSSSEEEVDGEAEDEEMANIDEVDADELQAMLQAGLMDDEGGEVELQANGDELSALLESGNIQVEAAETPTTAHDVAMHALSQNGNIVVESETAASTPAAATSADDDDDDDDADSDEDVDEVDEAAVAEEARQEQLRQEIVELEKAIAQSTEARDRQTNVLFRKRAQGTIDKQKADLAIKKKQLNEEADE